jgi:hypothetical protein
MLTAKVLFHVALLLGADTFDAYTTNRMYTRMQHDGWTFHENNPVLRPFAGKAVLYPAMYAGDLAVYGTLLKLHKPKAARWYARASAGFSVACGIDNLQVTKRVKPPLK